MEYLTVREVAQKWGISVRMVNYYLNKGRIPNAVRKTSEWLIPYDAKKPKDNRKQKENEEVYITKDCYMPLIAKPCQGSFKEFEESLEDNEERILACSMWYYFRNESHNACVESKKLFDSKNVQIRLSARLLHAMASIQTADAGIVRSDFNAIFKEKKNACDESGMMYCMITEGLVSVFFHSEVADLTTIEGKVSLFPTGMQYYMMYALAHNLYTKKEYQRAMGVAESAIMMAGDRFPIPSIYLNIVLTMICLSLKEDERAEKAFMRAWHIAEKEHYIHPFVEHHGLLQGQIERLVRKQYPEEYEQIIESVYDFSRGWMKIHNPVSIYQVTDALTTYEFSVAMLAAKGRSNKEIASHLGISVNTVKSYMESIFDKLHISSRSEIATFVNR